MFDAYSAVKYLSQTIGPRGSATGKEAEAALYVAAELKRYGLTPQTETFTAPKTYSWTFIIYYSAAIVSAGLFSRWPVAAFILSLLALFFYVFESDAFPLLGRLLARGRSQNVIGKAGTGERKIVISAHIDSSRASLANHPALVKSFRSTFMAATFALAAITFLNLWGIIDAKRHSLWFALPFVLYLFSPIFILLHREIRGKITPGANDNASGVAVLLALAAKYAAAPPNGTELIFLFTGAEEVGMWGMIDFYNKHKEYRAAIFINIDNVGSGELHYTTEEGLLMRFRVPPELTALAGKIPGITPVKYRAMGTDATAVLARGGKAITIIGLNKHGIPPNWHWETDTIENVDAGNLLIAEQYIHKLVLALAGKGE